MCRKGIPGESQGGRLYPGAAYGTVLRKQIHTYSLSDKSKSFFSLIYISLNISTFVVFG
jgi:hypothetical protein